MLNILIKELKDSLRDRRTLLLTVFLPLILMSALIFFYEKMLSTDEEESYEVVVKEGQLDFVQKLLADQESLHLSAVDNVEEVLEEGAAIAGIILPTDFEKEIEAGATPIVQILSDNYSQNSVVATSMIESAFMKYSQSIVAERLAANNVDASLFTPFQLEQVQFVEGDNAMMMIAFLVPLMLSIAVGVGISPAATDLLAGEKERRTMEALLMTPVKRGALLLAKWLTMVIIASLTGIITLAIVFVEIQFLTETLKAGIALGDQALTVVMVSILVIVSYAALMASALMVTGIVAKTIKESQSYSTPVTMISILPAMFMINTGLTELTFTHFAVPIMNIFAIFKELFFGTVNVEHILITIFSNIIVAMVIFSVGRVMFLKDKWVLAR